MRPVLLLLTLSATLHATEYFTARTGNDTADGLSPKTAFATVNKGLSGLQPGDTLTILPGTYCEFASAKISGTPEAPITIRAQRPGTVLLRGDVDAPAFRLAEGMRRTYVADFKQRIEGIAERGTYRLYQPAATLAEVEETNATYFQDDATGRVYVHTSDSAPANDRALAFSVTNGFGLLLTVPLRSKTVHDVVIDGLSFTGYQAREFPAEPGSRNRWGLEVANAEHVTVRRCTAYLNNGGIFLLAPIQCLVEECHSYGNVSRFQPVGNNILGWGISETRFRRNVVESFWPAGSSAGDITFYGGGAKTETSFGYMEENIAINAGIMTKGSAKHSIQTGNAAVGSVAYYYSPQDETNLLLKDYLSPQAFRTYADPLNHDFRRQAEAPGEAATEVFFVAPDGDDRRTGGSLKTAWRTLTHAAQTARPGDTIYLTAGEYREALVPAQSGTAEKPIRFLRRGSDRVVLDGGNKLPVGVDLSGRAHVQVNGLIVRNFTRAGIVARQGEKLRIENIIATGSGGDGASFTEVRDLDFTHNLLRRCRDTDLRLTHCTTINVTANVFDPCAGARFICDDSLAELWSDANDFPPAEPAADLMAVAGKKYASLTEWQSATGLDPTSLAVAVGYREADPERADFTLAPGSPLVGRAPGSTAIGPFVRLRVNRPVPVAELTLHDAADTTATVEWSTPAQAAESTLEWGEDPACPNKVSSPISVFHTVSLADLKPGTKYYYRVNSAKPYAEISFAACLPTAATELTGIKTEPQTFQTTATAAPPRTLHVAVRGSDQHTGLSPAEALRTINHAAELAHAGDTVLIHEGTYEETVIVRSSGTEKAPVIFRAAPGETVWMDGSGRFRTTAFRISGKHYVEIDGLRFRHFRYAPEVIPIIAIQGGSHISIRRCLHDGREAQGYVPAFIAISASEHFLVENTVFINGMGEGFSASRCPDVTVRHCVFYNNYIRAFSVNQFDAQAQLLNVSHNLFCDSLPWKTYNALLRVNPLDALRSNHNVYFARLGAAERNLVETFSIKGKPVGHADPGQYRGENLVLAALQKEAAQETDSRFGNPGIPVVAELVPPKTIPSVWQKAEMRWDGKAFGPLDFADFMPDANNPLARAADGEAVGLDPKAFAAKVP